MDMMDQFVKSQLEKLGFEQKIETLFSLVRKDRLHATLNYWEIFAYYEGGKYYFSDNGELVETFDAPDIDIVTMLEEIKGQIKKFGCRLNVSKIVKEINLKTLEKDFNDFVSAVLLVDKIYKEL